MSRCFPYPPPGYTLSRSSEDALIESIKLQKEREKAKEQRKERRKDKKERRKEKDGKSKVRKERANPKPNSDKYDISKGQCGKKFWASIDHLEKSGLTEEHEQPICLQKSGLTEEHEQPICLRIPSTSSDSTENSTKRKRDFYPVDCSRHGHGNIIRIRMASKKRKFSNSSIDEHICSTSGRTDIPAQNKDGIGHKSKQEAIYILTKETSKFGQGFTAKSEKEELICLISKNDAGVPGITGTSSVRDAVRSSIQKRESKYNKLFKTWLPQQLEDICPDTDLDWLFSGNNQCNQAEKRLKSECNSMSCSSSSTLWQPHARILPDVDVLALPFTVPFA